LGLQITEQAPQLRRGALDRIPGIGQVTDKVVRWFDEQFDGVTFPSGEPAGADALRVALTADGAVSGTVAAAFGELARTLVAGGAMVVVPDNASLLDAPAFRAAVLAQGETWSCSLAYGEPAAVPGLHVMEAPTESPVETLTGLGGCGAELMLAHVGRVPLQAHPMVPLLQVSGEDKVITRYGKDLDVLLDASSSVQEVVAALTDRLAQTASRTYTPSLYSRGLTSFQLTRGLLGVSM
jgi:hypothetical protein